MQKSYINQNSIFSLGRDSNKQKQKRRHNEHIFHFCGNNTDDTNPSNRGSVERYFPAIDYSVNFFFYSMEKLINIFMGMYNDRMGAEIFDSEEEFSKMFIGKKGEFTSDEELALHIMHRFNIDRDTMESMPAINQHLKPMFSREFPGEEEK